MAGIGGRVRAMGRDLWPDGNVVQVHRSFFLQTPDMLCACNMVVRPAT